MTTINDMFYQLAQLGVLENIVPFMLIFTVVYAVAHSANILGRKKNFHIILALTAALATVIPHVINAYPPGRDVIVIINKALPSISLIMIAAISLMLIIGVFGGGVRFAGTSLSAWVVIFSMLVTAWIFLDAAGIDVPNIPFFRTISPQTRTLIITILVFAIIIWFITREPGTGDGENPLTRAFSGIGDIIQDRYNE